MKNPKSCQASQSLVKSKLDFKVLFCFSDPWCYMKCGRKTYFLYMVFILDIFTYNFGKKSRLQIYYRLAKLAAWLSSSPPCLVTRIICPLHRHRVRGLIKDRQSFIVNGNSFLQSANLQLVFYLCIGHRWTHLDFFSHFLFLDSIFQKYEVTHAYLLTQSFAYPNGKAKVWLEGD